MNNTLRVVIITLLAFFFYLFLNNNYFSSLIKEFNNLSSPYILSYFIAYIIIGLPVILGLFLLHPPKKVLLSMGVSKNFFQGISVAFTFTLPMLIGYSVFFYLDTDISWRTVFIGAVFAAFFEEWYFRGFLFGQIFRYSRIGFIPAIIIGALVFASGHLYQSSDISILVGIFIMTTLGAVFFAWTYVEWNYNLWVPIGLHFFMNIHWYLFSAGNNALGGTYANIFRFSTIALVIIGTIIYKKRKGLPYAINWKTMWYSPKVDPGNSF